MSGGQIGKAADSGSEDCRFNPYPGNQKTIKHSACRQAGNEFSTISIQKN